MEWPAGAVQLLFGIFFRSKFTTKVPKYENRNYNQNQNRAAGVSGGGAPHLYI